MKNHHIYTQIHIKESQSPTTKIQSSLTKIQINLLGIINYPKKEKRKKERKKEISPSGPRLDRFLGSFKMDNPCLRTLSERLTLSLRTKQRYSQAPPPPLSTWISSLLSSVSSVFVTIVGKFPAPTFSLPLKGGFWIYRWYGEAWLGEALCEDSLHTNLVGPLYPFFKNFI